MFRESMISQKFHKRGGKVLTKRQLYDIIILTSMFGVTETTKEMKLWQVITAEKAVMNVLTKNN